MATLLKEVSRKKRQRRVRKRVRGTPDRPRLSVFRSNRGIFVQAVDDIHGQTLASASYLDAALKKGTGTKGDMAKAVGIAIGKKLLEKKISRAIFDRNGYQYHGRVKSLADGAREAGLEF